MLLSGGGEPLQQAEGAGEGRMGVGRGNIWQEGAME